MWMTMRIAAVEGGCVFIDIKIDIMNLAQVYGIAIAADPIL
jgi:hypothetical protein